MRRARKPGDVGVAGVAQPRDGRARRAGVDVAGQAPDARIAGKAVVLREPHRAVLQRAARSGGRRHDRRGGRAGQRREIGHAGRGERRVDAQLREHGARFDGGELVLVAQQDDARRGRHRLQQLRGERQVQHRGLVHHQRVDGQRVRGVVRETGGRDAQQPVHRGRRRGHLVAQGRGQVLRALADRVGHARGGLAGGRGQRDAAVGGERDQAGEQVDDRGGLAGAGAAADHGEPAAQRERGGELLPVGRTLEPGGVGGEQPGQANRAVRARWLQGPRRSRALA